MYIIFLSIVEEWHTLEVARPRFDPASLTSADLSPRARLMAFTTLSIQLFAFFVSTKPINHLCPVALPSTDALGVPRNSTSTGTSLSAGTTPTHALRRPTAASLTCMLICLFNICAEVVISLCYRCQNICLLSWTKFLAAGVNDLMWLNFQVEKALLSFPSPSQDKIQKRHSPQKTIVGTQCTIFYGMNLRNDEKLKRYAAIHQITYMHQKSRALMRWAVHDLIWLLRSKSGHNSTWETEWFSERMDLTCFLLSATKVTHCCKTGLPAFSHEGPIAVAINP